MSKMKRISASVMAFVLALCVGYFSMMSPTSAWFYESGVIDSGDSFIFGDLSVDTKFVTKNSIVFDGATRFYDPKEVLFDEVVNVSEVLVANTGTVPAKIRTDVVNKGSAKGLRWFVFTEDSLVDGSVRKTLESVLPSLSDKALSKYNADENNYIVCYPGEIFTLKVALWIDYDSVSDQLMAGKTLDGYDVEITLTAVQYSK